MDQALMDMFDQARKVVADADRRIAEEEGGAESTSRRTAARAQMRMSRTPSTLAAKKKWRSSPA